MGGKVTTQWANLAGVDYDELVSLSIEEPEYLVVCLPPMHRVLLQNLLAFQEPLISRWLNFPSMRVRDQLIAETLEAMYCPMACSDDIQAIDATLGEIRDALVGLSNKFGPVDADLDLDLQEIRDEISGLEVAVSSLDISTFIDKLEAILNGVGVILGAPTIPL